MTEKAKLLIFAGTSEGRRLAEELSRWKIAAAVCVATGYGRISAPVLPGIRLIAGRLDEEGMARLMDKLDCELAVDATHPYAAEASANIAAACQKTGREYLRVIRPPSKEEGVAVPDVAAAVDFLNQNAGKALLTTGSKDLTAFTAVKDYAERLYPRILPDPQAVSGCLELGFLPDHLICMQGPFSQELNAALIRQIGAAYLVTKDSGGSGGLPEKAGAAKLTGAVLLMISRPVRETGVSLEHAVTLLKKRYGVLDNAEAGQVRFPLFLDLGGKKAAVIGGGRIAERRIRIFLEFGAAVTVISPRLTPALRRLADEARLQWIERSYREGDLQGADIALAAADDSGVNGEAAKEADLLKIPISVSDDREKSSFWFPAIVREGGLIAGLVSEQGKNHALVKKKAEELKRFWRSECNEGSDRNQAEPSGDGPG